MIVLLPFQRTVGVASVADAAGQIDLSGSPVMIE
jgi:hypothetical protein